jgi:hypothetical protein
LPILPEKVTGSRTRHQSNDIKLNRWDVFTLLAKWLAPRGWNAPPQIPSSPIPWAKMISASSHHLVTPALAWRLKDSTALPPKAAEYFDAILWLNRKRNAEILGGLELALDRLNSVDVEPALLKGAGILAADLYPDRAMRFLGDVDLLVPEALLQQASKALREAGFIPQGPVVPGHHHLPVQVHGELGVGIELHFRPVHPSIGSLLETDACLDRASPLLVGNRRALLPSPTDRVALTIAHGQITDGGHAIGVPMLRSLLDLALHQHLCPDRIDWDQLRQIFARNGFERVIPDTLSLSNFLFDSEAVVPPEYSELSVKRLRQVINRPARTRLLEALGKLARGGLGAMRRSPLELLSAFSPKRWKTSFRTHYRNW